MANTVETISNELADAREQIQVLHQARRELVEQVLGFRLSLDRANGLSAQLSDRVNYLQAHIDRLRIQRTQAQVTANDAYQDRAHGLESQIDELQEEIQFLGADYRRVRSERDQALLRPALALSPIYVVAETWPIGGTGTVGACS